MSKAFQCDNCGELFPGDAYKVLDNGAEVCSGCFRAIKVLGTVDYFATIKFPKDRPGYCAPTEFHLLTDRHTQ